MDKTFKETIQEGDIEKEISKVGTSLGIVFSKEELKLLNLGYKDKVNLNDAKIVKTQKEQKEKNI